MGTDTTPSTSTANAPPNTTPPQRRRLALRRPPDHNRPFEILSILLVYIVAVHFLLKFASFFLLDEGNNGGIPPSREEVLGLRGAKGVLGFSLDQASSSSRGRTRWDGVAARDNCGSSVVVFCSNSQRFPERLGRRSISSSDRISGRYSGITTAHSLSESLREGSTIEITKEEFNINNDQNVNMTKSSQPTEQPTKLKKRSNRPRIPILSYQNDHVIVSKPPGMTMHHNSNTRWGRSKGPVLQTTIHKQLSRKPYLVHRLDHRTSGAVIMGFDSRTAGRLHGRLRRKDATKLYVALVRGDLRERFRCAAADLASPISEDDGDCWSYTDGVDMSVNGDGSIVGSFGRMPEIMTGGGGKEHLPPRCHENAGSEYNVKISVNLPIKANDVEKEAQTDFYFLSSMEAPEEEDCTVKPDDDDNNNNNNNAASTPYVTKSLTLLLCRPRTGRIHQIRRHTQKALCAPIIGDSEHGDSRVNRFWRETIGLDRLGLHCWYLGLPPSSFDSDPDRDNGGDDGGEEESSIECMAPLTDDFAKALRHEALRPLWKEAVRVEPRLEMEPYDERGGSFGRYYRKRIRDDGDE